MKYISDIKYDGKSIKECMYNSDRTLTIKDDVTGEEYKTNELDKSVYGVVDVAGQNKYTGIKGIFTVVINPIDLKFLSLVEGYEETDKVDWNKEVLYKIDDELTLFIIQHKTIDGKLIVSLWDIFYDRYKYTKQMQRIFDMNVRFEDCSIRNLRFKVTNDMLALLAKYEMLVG